MKKGFKLLLLLLVALGSSSCFKRDKMENINVYATVYPIEFIISKLYGNYSTVNSIYPSGSDITNYELTEKQKQDYSKADLFVYNGLSEEKSIARDFINKNKNMKIIDVSYGLNLEYSNYDEELWLSPNNFLMLATTVKNNLSEFISSKYIKEEINKNYEKIQEQVSIIDANLRNIASTSKASDNNVIITSTNALKFLENYGFKVISIEDDDNYTTELKNNFKSGKYKTLFIKKGESNDKINELKDTYKAKSVEVNMMDVLDDNERKNYEDYLSIMNSFLQNISDTCLNESK